MNNKPYFRLLEKYILNQATEQEVRELIYFLKTDPELNNWFEIQISDSLSAISDDLNLKMYKKICEKIGDEKRPKKPITASIYKWMRIAAYIILPVLIIYRSYYLYTNHKNDEESPMLITVERGEKANITLPDGSRVWLNSGSNLTYYNTYNKDKRFLQLNGEAYFEIVPNARKKFIVQCVDLNVEVLGTTFDIKAYDEDSIVSAVLVEGKVKIAIPDSIWEITPGERVVFNKSSNSVFSEMVYPNYFTEWRKNRLRFENEPFSEIAKTISRIYNIDYVFADESIGDLRFTGSVNNINLKSMMEVISLTSPITYDVKNDLIVFYKHNSKKKYFQ